MMTSEGFPEMDDADLLGLLFQGRDLGLDNPFSDGKTMMDDWLSEPGILDLDADDFISSLLGEDESPPSDSLSPLGSDSGISDVSNNPGHSDTDPAPSPDPGLADSVSVGTVHSDHCYSLQHDQLSGDALQSVRSERPDTDVFIDLDNWDAESMGEDLTEEVPCTLSIEDSTPSLKADQFQSKELILTDEERRLLSKEGVTIPTNMPLTKAEERTLKRVRRKIRNKQSAQDSRKKKKVYVDGLENRVAVCTAHNQELQKKVQFLQKQNMSLMEQLRNLQAVIKLSTMKTSTTSTCVMVFLLSFCLIIFPSVNPFGSSGGQKDLYAPTGLVSRTIRSIPLAESEDLSSREVIGEDELLLVSTVDGGQAVFAGSQNHTPDYQKVDQPESESAVNGNSSSDFPGPAKPDLKTAGVRPEGRRDSATEAPDRSVTGSKEKWIDRTQTISVIISKHRSDEM